MDAYFAMVFEWFTSIGYCQTVDLTQDIKIHHLSAHFEDFPKDELYKLQEKRGEHMEYSGGGDLMKSTTASIEYFYKQIFGVKNTQVRGRALDWKKH